MSLDKKLPKDTQALEEIAKSTDNPQMKRAIENRLKRMSNNNTVSK